MKVPDTCRAGAMTPSEPPARRGGHLCPADYGQGAGHQQHPELLSGRQVVRAGVPGGAPVPQAVEAPAAQPAAIEPGREIHLHLSVSLDQLAALLQHYTEGR